LALLLYGKNIPYSLDAPSTIFHFPGSVSFPEVESEENMDKNDLLTPSKEKETKQKRRI